MISLEEPDNISLFSNFTNFSWEDDESVDSSAHSLRNSVSAGVPSLATLEPNGSFHSVCDDVVPTNVGELELSGDVLDRTGIVGVKRPRNGDSIGSSTAVVSAVSESVSDAQEDYVDVGEVVPTGDVRNFRLRGKSFHLTYRSHLQPGQLFRVVGGEENLEYYSIVWEVGNHGAAGTADYPHTHFFFRTVKSLDRNSARTFDVDGVHPHIQKVSAELHEGRIYHIYHRKAPVKLWQSNKFPQDPSLYHDQKKLRATIQRGTLLEACLSLGIELKSVNDVRAIREERVPPAPAVSQYSEDDFSLKIEWWTMFDGRRTEVDAIFMYGGTGFGKTERALACFKRPLLCRSIDAARAFHPDRYDGIVFDDVSLRALSPEEKICLVDSRHNTEVSCRYSNASLPPGTKRIFTSNRTPASYFGVGVDGTDEQYRAILRRVKIIHVLSPTFNL